MVILSGIFYKYLANDFLCSCVIYLEDTINNIFKAVQPTATCELVEILTLRKNVSLLKNSVDVFAKLAMY